MQDAERFGASIAEVAFDRRAPDAPQRAQGATGDGLYTLYIPTSDIQRRSQAHYRSVSLLLLTSNAAMRRCARTLTSWMRPFQLASLCS